jgi:hypothetical protein
MDSPFLQEQTKRLDVRPHDVLTFECKEDDDEEDEDEDEDEEEEEEEDDDLLTI